MVSAIPAGQLTCYVERLFEAAGMTRGGAGVMAAAYVEADLRGIPGHGCRLVPATLEKLRAGRLNPRPTLTALHEADAAVVLDGDLAPGPLAARSATTIASLRAGRYGVGFVAVQRCGHAGALGIGAAQLADRGLVGLVAAQTSAPSVALQGGTGSPVLGNSAFAVAVPGPQRPVLVDLAAGAMSWGRVHQYARTGQALPAGYALTAGGQPTRDPSAAGVLLPAGERGQALAIVLELLVGALTGSSPLPAGHDGRGLICLAIDPAHLGRTDHLVAGVETVTRAVRAQGARMPGDRTWHHHVTAEARGIELDDDDLAALVAAGAPHISAPRSWPRSSTPRSTT